MSSLYFSWTNYVRAKNYKLWTLAQITIERLQITNSSCLIHDSFQYKLFSLSFQHDCAVIIWWRPTKTCQVILEFGMIKTSYNVLVLDLRVDTADIRLLLLFITYICLQIILRLFFFTIASHSNPTLTQELGHRQ